jgi:cell division septation protein DedD
MTAESETLRSILVQKTGQSEEEIRQNLQELTARIEEVAGTESSFRIEGLGTFTAGGGELKFKPSEQFETEINYRYAGMPSIELVEAFKETGSGVPVEQPEAPSESPQKDDRQPDRVDEAPEPEEVEKEPKEKERIAAISGSDKEEPAYSDEPEEKEADTANAEDERGIPKEKRKKEYAFQQKNRGKGLWVTAAAIFIIVILALGWLFFSHRLFSQKEGSQPKTAASADSVKSKNLSEKQEKDTTQAQTPDLAPTERTDHSTEKAGTNDSTSAEYGLMGNQNRQINDAYTIVVHSFRLKNTVKKIAKNLHDKGYRTVIFHGAKDEDIYWRVGVGQFKTIKDAQQAVEKLPEDYQSQKAHFIHRINH